MSCEIAAMAGRTAAGCRCQQTKEKKKEEENDRKLGDSLARRRQALGLGRRKIQAGNCEFVIIELYKVHNRLRSKPQQRFCILPLASYRIAHCEVGVSKGSASCQLPYVHCDTLATDKASTLFPNHVV
ncbi:hypothetical protein O6H91_19G048800 [Diphasiastrum complanatum]|uniref:Uncharacterized protein n=1 Tax=Diphasiastrum complanatum TaxID=34168 RepID=A0ACC2AVU7_DIPCM|nr:hypothetical protein O6H91_19G048800 [Diphasiastrum complanatum]